MYRSNHIISVLLITLPLVGTQNWVWNCVKQLESVLVKKKDAYFCYSGICFYAVLDILHARPLILNEPTSGAEAALSFVSPL